MQRHAIIRSLRHLADRIEAEIAGVADEMLRYRLTQSEWSIKEHVGHLRDAMEVRVEWVDKTLRTTEPMLMSWEELIGFREAGYADVEVDEITGDLRDHAGKIVNLLTDDGSWARVGVHPELGPQTVEQLVEGELEHQNEHIAQIRILKSAIGLR